MASQKILTIESQIELLAKLQTEIGHQFQDRIEQLNVDKNAEGAILAEAIIFPATLERIGFVSIIVLAIGTLFQLFSLT